MDLPTRSPLSAGITNTKPLRRPSSTIGNTTLNVKYSGSLSIVSLKRAKSDPSDEYLSATALKVYIDV